MVRALSEKMIGQHIELLLIALVFSTFICYAAWYKGFFVLPKFDKSKVNVSFLYVIGAFIIYIGLSIAYPYLAKIVISNFFTDQFVAFKQKSPQLGGWITIFGLLIIMLGLMVYVEQIQKPVRRYIWGFRLYEEPLLFLKNIGMGILTWLISYPVVVVVGQIIALVLTFFGVGEFEQVAVKFVKLVLPFKALFGVLAFCLIFVVPIIEETLFRGFLLNWLAKHLGRLWGIIISSIVFALFHFSLSQNFSNIYLFGSLFTLSCFLGFIYFRQRSLWSPIALHGTFNAITILFVALVS